MVEKTGHFLELIVETKLFERVSHDYGRTTGWGMLIRSLLIHRAFKGKIPKEILGMDIDFVMMLEAGLINENKDGLLSASNELLEAFAIPINPTTATKTLGFLEKLIEEYKNGFEQRYGIIPFVTRQDENCFKEIVRGIGEQRAMELVSKYCSYDNPYYVARKHPIMLLRSDINKVMVEINNPKAAAESRIAKEQLDRDAIDQGRASRIEKLEKKIEENRIREKREEIKKEEVVVVKEESPPQRKLTAEEIKIPGFINRGA